MTSRYRQTMSEAMAAVRLNELQSHTVRFLDPANGKRFAVPFKTHADAEKKMAQLKRDGVKDIKITMDTLKPGIKFKEVNEDADHEVSMARSELEAIADKALKLSSMLQGKSDEGNPLEAWVQSKITKAKDYITSVTDHMEYNPENAKEEVELEEAFSDAQIAQLKKAYEPLRDKKISIDNANKLRAMLSTIDNNKSALEKLYKADVPFVSSLASARLISKHNYKAQQLIALRKEGVDVAVDELKQMNEMFGNRQIDPTTAAALRKYLSGRAGGSPFPPVVEGIMSKIDQMKQDGLSAAQIAKELKIDVKTVKGILGEEELEEATAEEIASQQDAKFSSNTDKLKKDLDQKDAEIAQLKQKAEVEKAKYVQKQTQNMTNPETGEPLLTVGIAYKALKDKMAKEKAAEAKLEKAKEEQKKKNVSKFKDIARKVMKKNGMMEELSESDVSDKAKSMGLDYMKFGRYGKDGKVTHKNIGGNLQAVDKDEKPIKDTEPKKDEPKKDAPKDQSKDAPKDQSKDAPKDEPKQPEPPYGLNPKKMQNDLEAMVTDGVLDVEFDDADGSINMNKEYEPSQDYDAEQDMKSIIDYLKKKGVNPDDVSMGIDGGEEEEYLSLSVMITPKGSNTFKKESFELQEKLKVSDGLGAWIDDFVKSDAPQFDGKSKEKRKDMAIAAFTGAGGKLEQKEKKEHPAKKVYESIEAVKNKSKETGMPYSVLKQVYDRGMAAWRGGHRPGATQVQWALARVNSFVTKPSGTWGGADKDLAAKVKGSK